MKNTKIYIIAASLFFSASSAFAQNTEAFNIGDNLIGLGIGVGGTYEYINVGSNFSQSPNFILTYDHGTFNQVGPGIISLGGLFSFKSTSYTLDENNNSTIYDNSLNYYILGVRAAYHWNFTTCDQFDPYVGAMLAEYFTSFHTADPHYNTYAVEPTFPSYTAVTIYLGVRYYVSPSVGIWLELGAGYTQAAFGVNIKIKN